MCNPALAVMAVTTAMSVYSQQQSAKYTAQVAENNAIIAEQKADDAIARGEHEERRHRLQVEALKGQQRSALAANGGVLDEGSALDILADTAEQGELDALMIRSNAQREANDYRNQAGNFESQASMARFEGNMNSATTIIGNAGSVSNKWYKPGGGKTLNPNLTNNTAYVKQF